MNPLLQEALGKILRYGLALLAGYLVKAGIWDASDAETYVGAAAMMLLSLGWSVWVSYRKRLAYEAAKLLPAHATDADVQDKIADLAALNKIAKSVPVILIAVVLGTHCASARKIAIQADLTFAAAVFALDDAEWQAYQTHVITAEQHAQINPPITKALEDVKAVSLAIKAAPVGEVPASLPDLLADLQAVQSAILAVAPIWPEGASKAAAANTQAILLLKRLIGGAQ